MFEIGQVLAARYALLRRLHSGRWGEVWQARDGEGDREVALKILAPELAGHAASRARFLGTSRLQAEMQDPALLACKAVVDGDPCFAVLELAPGGDLSAWRGRPWTETRPALERVARGLAALHAQGFVHRDLKPANVVLDADGNALLSDLGVAARIGEGDPPPPGSPFSASPQQLRGEPPAIADDVYGFGALAYELLSGYPPHYPDEAAARSGARAPDPVRARVPLPVELQRLLLSCLSSNPVERPADMAVVAAALAHLPAAGEAPQVALPAQRVSVRAPADAAAPIEPRWRRPDGGSAAAMQGVEGKGRRVVLGVAFAVLLAGVALVVFVLPRLVPAPPVAAPAAEDPARDEAARAALRASEQRDLKRLAELKREYEQALPKTRERLDKLVARSAVQWGGEPFARARKGVDAAAASFAAGDYEQALAQLKSVDPELAATEAAAAAALQAALEAGRGALEAGDAAQAGRHYALALQIAPGNAQAARGVERSRGYDEVRRLLGEAERLERDGQAAEAVASYRKALALDRDSVVAQQALARLASAQSSAAFSAAMSEGLAALGRGEHARAKSSFERAAAIRPGAPEAQDGLAQVARAQGDATISGHLVAAERAEREERWQAALESWRRALAIDGNLLPAQQGVERTEPRAALEAQLNSFAGRPDRLSSSEVRAAARSALGRAASISPAGPVLRQQVATVTALVEAAEVPVPVALTSDNQTDVTIYRIGRIGLFEQKDMQLLPGRYTIVGTRTGYRDVRRELNVVPGQAPAPVAIRCEEPI